MILVQAIDEMEINRIKRDISKIELADIGRYILVRLKSHRLS